MPYTAAQLTTIYTNIHAGLAPNAAQQQLLSALASQNNAGTLSDGDTLQRVIDTADADSAVAISSYQFFTGTSPSAAGLAFLVNSTTNTTDLNDAYYQNFNQTNRYINFAANLGTGAGAGAAGFSAAYGALSFSQAVDLAYETVIGTNNATAAGVDPNAGKAYIVSQLPYFTALANQNFPTATAAQKDLIIKAEMVGYILSEAMKANLGTYANATAALLGDLGPDNTANLGTDLLASYAAGTVTLTSGVDIRTANVFNAPRTFTPGGTDQINSLNDDDVLTGAGTNPTLNFTFVNDADTGDNNIVPTLNNVQTVNIAYAGDASALVLDAQDSTGIKAVNITRISDNTALAAVRNLQAVPTNLSVANSNSQATTVEFSFSDAAASGTADATSLTVSNVQVGRIIVEEAGSDVDQGVETLTLISTGNANKIGVLQAEDLKSLVITGGQKLTLGTQTAVSNANQTEATRYGAGLANVAGSLTSVDASAMTAALDISLGTEVTSNLEDTSGTPVNFTVKGGAGNDMIRLLNGLDGKGDTVDGGGGTNTVQVYASVAVGSVTNVQNLDVRAGQDANTNFGNGLSEQNQDVINIDTSLFPQLAAINVRNEGMNVAGGVWAPIAEAAVFNLTKLTAATASAITIQHGTTGNNGINFLGTAAAKALTTDPTPAPTVGSTTIVATLATDTASDTVGVTIANGVNIDPRSNFTLIAGTAKGGTNVVENITITDSDTESNSVMLSNYAVHTGTITLNGGQVGNYLDLDVTANGANKDMTGGSTDGKAWLDPGAGSAATERLVATTINGANFVGDLILRVGNPAGSTGAQTITTGSGNDIVIFDVVSGVGNTTAGLSISDVVSGGAGSDQLVLDGNGVKINVGASEWTHVSGFETLRLIGVGNVPGGLTNDAYGNNGYNITLTNDFITNNNTTSGGIQRIAIVNDNDPTNDAKGGAHAGAANSGVTIDALQLDATHSFSYNGDEGAGNATADRFIMSDANINGSAIIDGGYAVYNTAAGNADVLEVRNGAVVTIGDLANVKNVGTIQFTNDQAVAQSSNLELDSTTIDALVNSSHTASTTEIETLNISVVGNPNVANASTNVRIDTSSVDFTKFGVAVDLVDTAKAVISTNGGVAISNFTSGTDAFDYQGTPLQNGTTTATTALGTITPTALAANATATANDVIFASAGGADTLAANTTAATAVANAVSVLTAGGDFAAANVSTGDSFLLLLSDGTNTWVFNYVADAAATVTTAADLTLVAEIVGVTPAGFAMGDFI